MSHVVLHVHMATAKDFQAKGAKQVFSVFMNCAEVVIHIREEGGSVVTNLRENKNKVRTKYSKYKLHKSTDEALPDRHRASLLVCDYPSCALEVLALSRKPIHRFYSWLGKEKIKLHLKHFKTINLW